MTLRIITPGPLSLLQDLGRYGYQHIGVTPGGPMDEHAFSWANRLLDNVNNAAQIEITMGQFNCEFLHPTMIALTGADMNATLNGEAISPWKTYFVNANDRLLLGIAQSGLRSYLAVTGGFNVDLQLGSCATVMRDNLGGLNGLGEKLKANDVITYCESKKSIRKRTPDKFIGHYPALVRLAVIPSYQYEQFSATQRRRFFAATYIVSAQIDRMGYRLSGEAISCNDKTLASEGIALGAIQIPSDGQPIVLMRDRQTIGGYPKIGCLTSLDISKLAQCQPGTRIQFYEKELYLAESEYLISKHFFNKEA